MDINWSYKNKSRVFDTKESAGVPYLSFKALDDTGLAVNGFPPAWAEPAGENFPP